MIAVWESDISDAFLIPRLNCSLEPTLFKSWNKLFRKQAPLGMGFEFLIAIIFEPHYYMSLHVTYGCHSLPRSLVYTHFSRSKTHSHLTDPYPNS